MDKIKTWVLNPAAVKEAETMMVCAARLTQRGEKIKTLKDFINLYDKPYTKELVAQLAMLPHPTLQKMTVINVVVVGASRRFLAQITRHQNEVKFMSASLQYSDYSGNTDFVVPYDLLNSAYRKEYIEQCLSSMAEYTRFVAKGVDNDTAGYLVPQSLRNTLIISATAYQWKHMISQRVCRRNTDETRYIMLQVWAQLFTWAPSLFNCGPFCMQGGCKEGNMCCGQPISRGTTPADILKMDFPLCAGGTDENFI